MIRRSAYAVVLLLLLLLPVVASAVQVSATLDRGSMQLGETVTLNVRVEGTGSVDMPDFSPLTQDFDVLGSSQNRSVSISNGSRQAEVTFGVALRPKRAGTLQIPALHVAGMQTAPLTLQVNAAAGPLAGAVSLDTGVFLEAQADPTRAYVGQQVSYVVRLFYSVNLGGAIDTPQIDGVQMTKVGDDLKYTAERGGRSWNVLERRFAVVPQHAGTVQIPALGFDGEVSDPNDPGGIFGSSTPVSASAPPITLDVQAAPASAGGSAWLPARDLALSLDGLPATTPVRVGQPLNLTMQLRATGLAADALPLPTLPTLDGATVYPDKPIDSTDHVGPWLLGQRRRAFAVVPDRAGTLTIPATSVTWWNVLTDRAEVARIPARQLTVLPALGEAGGAAAKPTQAAPTVGTASVTTPATPARVLPWRWIALGSIALWLLAAGWWWRARRSGRREPTPDPVIAVASTRTCRQAFLAAARGDDVAAQTRTLLAWARAERPSIQHLCDLAAALADAGQCAAIAALQRRRYAPATIATGAERLADVFKRGLAWREPATGATASSVPPLYPFKLR